MAVSLRRPPHLALWLVGATVLVMLGALGGSVTPPTSSRDRIGLADGLLCPPPPGLAPLITAVPIPLDAIGCALGAADVEVLTQFRRADGTMLVRRHRTLIGVPALVNADPDLLPDLVVTPTIRNLHEFAVRIERLMTETSTLPVSVELIVNDPTAGGSLPRDRMHLGYDARDTRAPRLFHSVIGIGEEANGDPRVQLENDAAYGIKTPAALTVVGGLFDGESLDRTDPLGGRLTYTPMPPTSTIDLGIGERYRVGLGASQPVTLDAQVEMVTGANEKRATAHLDPLPQSVEASYVPGATADQRTVTVTSSAIVDDVDLAYRETESEVPLLGAVLHATDLPTLVTVEQTAERAGTVDTNGAFGSVEFGLADGDPVLGTADGPYVKLLDDGTHSSVAARIDGLRRASVDATDTIHADLEVTPAGRKPVAIDVERPGLDVTGSVADLPEHLTLDADLDGPVVTYDGHGQGLDDLAIEAVADDPLFARATDLRAHATDLPAAFVFEVRKRHVEPNPGVVLLDGIEVTSSSPIGTVEFEADDGGASVLPAGAGATYLDTPARFAIAARVTDFERVSLLNRIGGWTELGTTLGAGPFHVKVQTNDPTVPDDALLIEGDVVDLPHVLDARVRPPSETHDGTLDIDADADIGAIDLRVEPQLPLMERQGADPDIAIVGLEGIPAELTADVVMSDSGASVTLDHAIDEVDVTLTSGPLGQIGDDEDDSGAYLRALPGQFTARGRLHGVTGLSFAADPLLVDIDTTQAQPFSIDAQIDDPTDSVPTATITGAIQDLPSSLTFSEDADGFLWEAEDPIGSLTLDATNLPGGALNDGGVHFADLEISQIPESFRIRAGGDTTGVEVLSGGSIGRIAAQVSDAPHALLGSFEGNDNAVLLESLDAVGDTPASFTAFVRIHDLQRALYTTTGEASSEMDVAFGGTDPAAITVNADTTALDLGASVADPPQWFTFGNTTGDSTILDWDAATSTDADIDFVIDDAAAADLLIDDIAPHTKFCLSTAHAGCETRVESPHEIEDDEFYTIPGLFHTYLRTTGEQGPITMNGVVCLKPVGVDATWHPVCEWQGTNNSAHQVSFHGVQVTDYQVDAHSGDSVELDGDGDPQEDDLVGVHLDVPSFRGKIHYQANQDGDATTVDSGSVKEFESIGEVPFSADHWELVGDTTGIPFLRIGGSFDCGSDSALRIDVPVLGLIDILDLPGIC